MMKVIPEFLTWNIAIRAWARLCRGAATVGTAGEKRGLATLPALGWAQGRSGAWERSDLFYRCQVGLRVTSWRRSGRRGRGREGKRCAGGRAVGMLVGERRWEAAPWLLALARPMGSRASANLSAGWGNRWPRRPKMAIWDIVTLYRGWAAGVEAQGSGRSLSRRSSGSGRRLRRGWGW